MMSSPIPFWKQIIGAIAGAAAALMLYGIYEGASSRLQAYVLPPDVMMKDARTARRSLSEDTARKFERIANQARASVRRFQEQQELVQLEENLLRIGTDTEAEGEMADDAEDVTELESTVDVGDVVTEDMPIIASTYESIPVEELPNSGIAMTLSAVGALLGAAVLRKKRSRA